MTARDTDVPRRATVLPVVLGLLAVPLLLAVGEGWVFHAANRPHGTIESGGLQREYRLHVPRSYDRSKPTPLVISMHGAGLWGAAQQEMSRWDEVADRERTSTANEEAHIVKLAELRDARAAQPAAIDAASFQRQRSQLSAGARAVDEAAEAALVSREELRMAQTRLYETARERKTLERLDDRDRAMLAVLASRASQRALDDLVTRKSSR